MFNKELTFSKDKVCSLEDDVRFYTVALILERQTCLYQLFWLDSNLRSKATIQWKTRHALLWRLHGTYFYFWDSLKQELPMTFSHCPRGLTQRNRANLTGSFLGKSVVLDQSQLDTSTNIIFRCKWICKVMHVKLVIHGEIRSVFFLKKYL